MTPQQFARLKIRLACKPRQAFFLQSDRSVLVIITVSKSGVQEESFRIRLAFISDGTNSAAYVFLKPIRIWFPQL
jgi:hypothetical protein